MAVTLDELDYRVEVFRDESRDWIAVPTEATHPYWPALRRLSGIGTRPDLAVTELLVAMSAALASWETA